MGLNQKCRSVSCLNLSVQLILTAPQPEKHTVINIWPHNKSDTIDGTTSDKVPSEIAYEYDEEGLKSLWGFQIPSSMPSIKWAKLQLAPKLKPKVESLLSSKYKDCRDNPIPYHSSPQQAVTDYLRHLYEHIIKVLKIQKSKSFSKTDLQFVLTVPAVWPEKAKIATRDCAHAAGFGEKSEDVSFPSRKQLQYMYCALRTRMAWRLATQLSYSMPVVVLAT